MQEKVKKQVDQFERSRVGKTKWLPLNTFRRVNVENDHQEVKLNVTIKDIGTIQYMQIETAGSYDIRHAVSGNQLSEFKRAINVKFDRAKRPFDIDNVVVNIHIQGSLHRSSLNFMDLGSGPTSAR